MVIKGLIDEDFINYRKPSMFIIMPYCDFKCEKDCGVDGICQNSAIIKEKNIYVDNKHLINKYLNNNITKSIVFGGMEPFLSLDDLVKFLNEFRDVSDDDVVIYTGYTEEEVQNMFPSIYKFDNIIIKFGRYIPNQKSHFDEILGIELASPNQYAKKF